MSKPADESRRETLEAIGKLSAKIGHDFNNLFGALIGCLDLLERRVAREFPDENPFERQFALMHSSMDKAVALTSKLRGYVRPGPIDKERGRLSECIEPVVEALAEYGAPEHQVEIQILDDPEISLGRVQVVSVLTSLCINSLEAMKKNEERFLVLFLQAQDVAGGSELQLPEGRYALLSVVDHGIGMSDEVQSQAMQPFFSTKSAGIGTGIGLSLAMAHEVMRKHGGRLAIQSKEGCGTVVHLYFPTKQETGLSESA